MAHVIDADIRGVLQTHNGRLAPANRQLTLEGSVAKPKAYKLIGGRGLEPLPEIADPLFTEELYFIEHEKGSFLRFAR